MKRFILILILIFALLVGVWHMTNVRGNVPLDRADRGLADLHGVDVSSQVATLNGEWEFVYGSLLTPAEFPNADADLIRVPGSWEGAGYSAFGYATYRLTILTGEETDLLLFLPEITGSALVFVNGREVFTAGTVGDSPGQATTAVRNGFVAASPEDGAVELVIQVSNYQVRGSGLTGSIDMGRTNILLRQAWQRRVTVAMVLGGILLIGLYHLVLFLFRGRGKTYLLFFIICVLTVLRLSLETNSLGQFFLPGGLSLVLIKGYMLLICLQFLFTVLFMILAFRLKLGKGYKCFFIVTLGVPIFATFFPAPIPFFGMITVLVPLAATLALCAWRGNVKGNPYQILYLCSIGAYLVNGPINLLIPYTLFVPGTAPNLFMILCQCVMLSQSYAAAHDEVEQVNASLEATVAQRTAELQQAYTQVATSEQSLKELVGNISHDLKTPLTVVGLQLQLLTGPQAKTEEETRRMLSVAYSKTLDLQRLTRNLFETVRMEEGRVTFKLTWMRLSELMDMVYDRYNDYVEDEGRMLAIRYSGDMEIRLDMDKIWTVFDNTINNALRYTPKDGSITVTVDRAGPGYVELTIRDTGSGIEPEHLPHIFDRYYKADKSRGPGGDSGLGLYIVKSVVEGMEGMVRASSPPGEGASIIVTLRARELKN